MKAGGSRELPSAWLFSRFAKVNLTCKQNRCTQSRLGRSQEPPVAACFGYTNDRNNEEGVTIRPKRLPFTVSDRTASQARQRSMGGDLLSTHRSNIVYICVDYRRFPALFVSSHGPPSTYGIAISGEACAGPRIRLRKSFLRRPAEPDYGGRVGATGTRRSRSGKRALVSTEEETAPVCSDPGRFTAGVVAAYCLGRGCDHPDLHLCDESHRIGWS